MVVLPCGARSIPHWRARCCIQARLCSSALRLSNATGKGKDGHQYIRYNANLNPGKAGRFLLRLNNPMNHSLKNFFASDSMTLSLKNPAK